MTSFEAEVKDLEKRLAREGYDEKAERDFLKRWHRLTKRP